MRPEGGDDREGKRARRINQVLHGSDTNIGRKTSKNEAKAGQENWFYPPCCQRCSAHHAGHHVGHTSGIPPPQLTT